MSRELLWPQHLAQAASDALHAPATKTSALASTVVVSADWIWSGPGLVAMAGLAFTAATFLVNVWSAYRKDRRADQERREAAAINAAKLKRLEMGLPLLSVDSDAAEQEKTR